MHADTEAAGGTLDINLGDIRGLEGVLSEVYLTTWLLLWKLWQRWCCILKRLFSIPITSTVYCKGEFGRMGRGQIENRTIKYGFSCGRQLILSFS